MTKTETCHFPRPAVRHTFIFTVISRCTLEPGGGGRVCAGVRSGSVRGRGVGGLEGAEEGKNSD